MNADTRYEPSPLERERAQVALFEATGGSEGSPLEGRPRACETFPKFAGYRQAAGRDVPLYVLEPA